MGFGSDLMDKLKELTGSLGSDGSILPGKEDVVNYLIGQIKDRGDVDISVVDVLDPETGETVKKIQAAEYVNPDTGEVVPATIYNSYNEAYDGIIAAGEFKTSSEYFGTEDVYVGCLSTTGGEKLARALTFASGANLQYFAPTPTTPDSSGAHVHTLISSNFTIRIAESFDGAPATIRLMCPSVKTGGGQMIPISAFNEDWATESGQIYIKYYIRKGATGDCYLKGIYTSDATVPIVETAEEDFADITMNAFMQYNEGNVVMTSLNGGFALVQMEDKVTKDSEDDIWSTSYSENSNYALVLWRSNGSPFHIGYIGETSKWNEDYATTCWNRVVTNSDNQVVALAPIFNPGSGRSASTNSKWSMIIAQEGAYLLSVGDGGTYYYDHGFALRND